MYNDDDRSVWLCDVLLTAHFVFGSPKCRLSSSIFSVFTLLIGETQIEMLIFTPWHSLVTGRYTALIYIYPEGSGMMGNAGREAATGGNCPSQSCEAKNFLCHPTHCLFSFSVPQSLSTSISKSPLQRCANAFFPGYSRFSTPLFETRNLRTVVRSWEVEMKNMASLNHHVRAMIILGSFIHRICLL